MLFHDDVMADRQAEPRSFTGRLGREEGVEHLLGNLRWNTGAIIANPNFNAVTKVISCGGQCGLIIAPVRFSPAFGGGVKPVRDQVEQDPRDLLREQIGFASSRVEGPLNRDIEVLSLRPRPVIGEIKAFFDESVDIDRSMLAGTLARMQQHVLDDGVGAFAMLYDLIEIALQHTRDLIDICTELAVEGSAV